ncbi:MAG: helix-turn-helix transcriptional regulator [Saprospiraceae bacterium]|nr:helix-turn-helix transcriptional regulator [Saprospiraceae bacterium]
MDDKPLNIKSIVVNPNKWIETMSSQMPSVMVGNKLFLDKYLGEGFASVEVLQEGLYYIVINATFNKSINYNRLPEVEEEHYLVIISLTDGPTFTHLDNEEYRFKISENFNALIVPPSILSQMKAVKDEEVLLLTIVVGRRWIEDNIIGNDENSYIRQLLNAGQPIPIVEQFNLNHRELIENLFYLRYKDKIQKLSSVIELISYLIDSISRKKGFKESLINSNDMKLILESCMIIEQNWKAFLSIKSLATQVKMGESSFKLKFKKVTGYSPYQFYLKIKMEKAKELLLNSNKSISEIGYICGYTNLSHFSRQFKKEFGVLPSVITKNRNI